MDTEQLQANLAHWDEAAELHVRSYNIQRYLDDPGLIADTVSRDQDLLAPFLPESGVAGLDLIHLQCHIGTDTLSWARLGARVTGLDLSEESLRVARDLATQSGSEIDYVRSSIHDAATALAGRRSTSSTPPSVC